MRSIFLTLSAAVCCSLLAAAEDGPANYSLWPRRPAELEQARRAAHLLGGALEGVLDAPVPGRDWQHVLLVCAKRQKTARQYPRRAGLPGKNPLG